MLKKAIRILFLSTQILLQKHSILQNDLCTFRMINNLYIYNL